MVGAIYLDCSKAFNTITEYSQHTSIDVTVWMDGQREELTTGWMTMLRRQQTCCNNAVTQGPILKPVFFLLSLAVTKNTHSSLQMTPNWMEQVNTFEGRAAMQRYLNRQEEWADRNHMKFNKTCKVLERNNPLQMIQAGEQLCVKNLGVLVHVQQASREPGACLGSKEGLQYPWLLQQ